MIPAYIDKHLLKVQKPARYCGGELGSVVKDKHNTDLRIAFCFPDLYEVGMSHLGMKILYSLLNESDNIWCERVFEPDDDFRKVMLENHIPLYGLESFDPLTDFDIIAVTIQYELCYTTILDMLTLGSIPLMASERTELKHLVVGGGPCVCNAEPLCDFFDIFLPGEGEEVWPELAQLYIKAKKENWDKRRFLESAAQIEGVYVPSLYSVKYLPNGRISSVTAHSGAPSKVRKRIVKDFDNAYFPKQFVVPLTDVIHDRVMIEVLRGCIRGCRFCQAGYIYRPFREKSPDQINDQARTLCDCTGYDEVSLMSLSTSDHNRLEAVMSKLISWTEDQKISLAVPSLRIDNFSPELLETIKKVRKSGLTFAPEAGSQRLRDAINKNITEEEVLRSCAMAFAGGYSSVKLYFMMGLPTETEEDIAAINLLAQKIVDLYYSTIGRQKGRGVTVTVSVACFVPKPFTPFQYEPQDSQESFKRKQKLLLETVSSRKININYHDSSTSRIEAVLARGDRRLGQVIHEVYRQGGRLESWDNYFSLERWESALAKFGLDADFYACRKRDFDEVFPWDHMDYYIDKSYLQKENEAAYRSLTTPSCREKCGGCGAQRTMGGECSAKCKSTL